jgi:alpha-L-rhamnosidase
MNAREDDMSVPSSQAGHAAIRLRRAAPSVILLVAGALVASSAPGADSASPATPGQLRVEYSETPLGIDVAAPRFGWQMQLPPGLRGVSQSAYRIVVTGPDGATAWDTGKVASAVSLAIPYAGSPLEPSTRYVWTVTVWDQTGAAASQSSWFETGLMNPDPRLAAWDGASWIGGGENDLVLYSQYLSIFDFAYTVEIAEGSSRAGFVFGANDARLMDRNKNIYQLQAGRDESYLMLELDVSAVDGSADGLARLNVYRVGYQAKDSKEKPFHTFRILPSVVNQGNAHAPHRFEVRSVFGEISVTLDGNDSFFRKPEGGEPTGTPSFGPPARGASVNLNPTGRGGDYITYGMLCDLGFSAAAGQKASFWDVSVSNHRAPHSTLFRERLDGAYDGVYAESARTPGSGLRVEDGRYRLDGGTTGAFVVADPTHNSTPMLRTEFTAGEAPIRDARLYVTARGIYEVYLNGSRVGDRHYTPGLTQYNETHMYQTYDVTAQVRNGRNALGAMLGEGWWSGLLSFTPTWNHFGDRQSLLAKLVIRHQDGSVDVVTSNPRDWKYFSKGPVVYSSLDMGEVYDARKEAAISGWSAAAFDDRAWESAREVPLSGTAVVGAIKDAFGRTSAFSYDHLELVGQIGQSPGVFETLTAKSVQEVRDGVYVYDMGQNFVGVPRITFRSGRAGQRVVLRVAEMLYPDLPESGKNVGMIMTENYRAALAQDIYVSKDGRQVFEPAFTFRGYRYLEITGIPEALPLSDVQGVAISSVHGLTAAYETSSSRVNQLWSNLVWSNVDNFLSIPTDCPQRNERMGWSGDISVFSRTATYVSNADQFLTRHMRAMRDVQSQAGRFTDVAPVGGGFGGVLWGSAGLTVAWEVYQQYGDTRLLAEHYPAMAAYVDYLETTIGADGLSSDSALGDWLGPQNNQLGSDFLATAYHVYDLWIVTRTAEILGKDEDAAKYRGRYEARRKFFNERFVNEDGKTMGLVGRRLFFGDRTGSPGEWKLADTQTSYAVGLALGAFSDATRPTMEKNLAATVERPNVDDDGVSRPSYSLMTGFIGTAWISKALSDAGRDDLAYRILQARQYPSWLYAVDQGATTIWERLNGYTIEKGFGGNNSMNSFNHYSFGAVGQWMMAYSLGIARAEPGFKRFVLQPRYDPTGEMTWARGHYDSTYGRVESAWKVDGTTLTYAATVPANTTATLHLPARSRDSVREGGQPAGQAKGVTFVGFQNGQATFELASGRYEFTTDVSESGAAAGERRSDVVHLPAVSPPARVDQQPSVPGDVLRLLDARPLQEPPFARNERGELMGEPRRD